MAKSVYAGNLVCGTVGLGYVGLPLAVEKAKAGFKTIGFEVSQEKCDLVNAGHNYIGDVVDSDLKDLVESGMLEATTDFSRIAECGFVAICVPTPLDEHQQPDTSFMEAATRSVSPYVQPGTMVVMESTTYPGTTEELIRPILEEGSGLKCGTADGFFLGFSPERVDPGNKLYKTKNTPKVVGAIGEEALERIAAVYEAILDAPVKKVSSPGMLPGTSTRSWATTTACPTSSRAWCAASSRTCRSTLRRRRPSSSATQRPLRTFR